MRTSCRLAAIVVLLGSRAAVHAQAPAGGSASQPAGAGDVDLAKQLSNPVASLVSVPLQFNWDQPVGIDDDTRFTLNLQPVVPFGLNDDWNMIVRWIMPYVAQPRLSEGGTPTSGLSDSSFPMSVGGGVGVFTAAPGGRPDWRLRFVATLLLPRK